MYLALRKTAIATDEANELLPAQFTDWRPRPVDGGYLGLPYPTKRPQRLVLQSIYDPVRNRVDIRWHEQPVQEGRGIAIWHEGTPPPADSSAARLQEAQRPHPVEARL